MHEFVDVLQCEVKQTNTQQFRSFLLRHTVTDYSDPDISMQPDIIIFERQIFYEERTVQEDFLLNITSMNSTLHRNLAIRLLPTKAASCSRSTES